MRHIRSGLITTACALFCVVILADLLRPLLPWLCAVIILGCIARLLWRR
jgi:hypothetical protein